MLESVSQMQPNLVDTVTQRVKVW